MTIQSNSGPQETMDRLEAEIKAHGMTVFARISHAKLARQVGLELRPTELILFGNPRSSTPFMQGRQTIGIDLPLKALVWQDAAGKTWLSYNEPSWLARRHEIAEAESAIATMGLALNDLITKTTIAPSVERPRLDVEPNATEKRPMVEPENRQATKSSIRPTEAPRSRLMPGLIVIGGVIAGLIGLFAYAGGCLTPRALTPARIANTFQVVNGVYPGFRRNHAKGVCVSGYFNSNGQGAALSKASIFKAGRVSVIGRFSLSGGKPFVTDAPQTVRGLGLRFMPSDGQEWRTAMINLPVFPVRTPQAFYEQLMASAPDPATGKPAPEKMEAFLGRHPESAKAIQLIHSHPMSSGFENSTFNSLNSFRFVNASRPVAWVRWSLVPVQPLEPITATPSGPTNQNQLFDALIASVHRHPLEWHLIITVAQPGDPTNDATLPWPPNRQQVDAGTLTIDRVESDDISSARDINFDPLVLPNGISASDDPLLSARSAVYSQSFTRREGERKQAAAVSAVEAEK